MKYEKPILANLCQEVGTGATCAQGSSVAAGTCRNRGFSATVGCNAGTNPGPSSGCTNGIGVRATCTSGATPHTTCGRGNNVQSTCSAGSSVGTKCSTGGTPTS